jgi:hypothetical protein
LLSLEWGQVTVKLTGDGSRSVAAVPSGVNMGRVMATLTATEAYITG